MAKRKQPQIDSRLVRSYLYEHGLESANRPAFIRNDYLRSLYEQLHVNVLYSWLRGDLGPLDRPVVTFDFVWNTWCDMNTHGFFTAGYITDFYVNEELRFWRELCPGWDVELGVELKA